MNFVLSTTLQVVFFGAFSLLMVLSEPVQPSIVIALFVAGELGGTSILCSAIVKRLRQGSFPNWLTQVIVGYIVSHIALVNGLHWAIFDGRVARIPSHGNLDWMELTLRVSLGLVLLLTIGVLSKSRVLRFAEAHIRKFTAAI